MKRNISLYNIEDFRAYVNQQESLGRSVQSVTYFVKNEEIAKLVPYSILLTSLRI